MTQPGRTAIVTGAGKRVGAEVARALLADGWLVVAHVHHSADDVPEGKRTDFMKAVQANPDEAIVFSWIEFPDKATRNAAGEKMMSDPRMQELSMPFDGARMIYGGFEALFVA